MSSKIEVPPHKRHIVGGQRGDERTLGGVRKQFKKLAEHSAKYVDLPIEVVHNERAPEDGIEVEVRFTEDGHDPNGEEAKTFWRMFNKLKTDGWHLRNP